ncbi:E3 ubiquitin-protein ligase TRIM62 isoform X2 [Latimeria chalumnae]|uniref:E3 ubiquitin-protein ligase TRIM62 isoform X2 n=1 Tax=Latimeria chalumnae TaxID=7897 RepID=UPI0003C16067|nr:PREDICTED: E3 ubiquitin-protein ligase TRIM62-like isoform X2 [Latimeria chalumnae]|eukprot:XP_005998198.1 PREDICTED: E3 ubiquitin-protein ligase TRIM62-like isoform X2 [Latimeria chalumnae]
MASGMDYFRPSEELLCSVCLEVLEDPVETDCSHYFCRACIEDYWKQKDQPNCPECRAICSNTLRKNRFVSNMVESFRQARARALEQLEEALCTIHGRKLERFCLTDRQLICLDCRDSRKHQRHEVLILPEAAKEFKAELRISLSEIKGGREKQIQEKRRYETLLTKLQSSARDAERKIKDSYRKLRTFLDEEEASLLKKLKEDEAAGTKKLEEKLQKLSEEIDLLERKIVEVEKDLSQQDHVTFFQKFADTQKSAEFEASKEEDLSIELVPEKYQPLLFYTWKKLFKEISVVLAVLTFDENTAAPNIEVASDDKKSITRSPRREVPDAPQRFDRDAVLATEGFSAGVHYWEVEVKVFRSMDEIKNTLLGVAHTSVQRTSGFSRDLKNGFWVCPIGVVIDSWQRKRKQKVSKRGNFTVGVYLSYEEGTVSFYDAELPTAIPSYGSLKQEK